MEQITLDLLINDANSAQNLGNLEGSIEKLKAQLKGADFGTDEFKKLSAALQDAQSKVKTLEKQFEGLEPQQVAESFVKVGEGIAGGFAAATGAVALFGSENEHLQEAVVKSQAAISIAMGARSISEAAVQGQIAARVVTEKASAIATSISSTAQAAYTTVVGGSTGALKVFRLAMIATGLGAFAVLIGLVVANWDRMKTAIENNTDKIKDAAVFFLKFMNPIGLVITGIQELGKKFQFVQNIIDVVKNKAGALIDFIQEALIKIGVLDSAEENAAEAELERAEAKLEALEKIKKERERQIELAKAEGKSANEIRDLEIKALEERLQAYESMVNAKKKLGEEVSDDEAEQLKDLQFQLKKAQLDDARLTKDESDKALKEEQDKQKKLAEERKRAAEERKKQKEEEIKRLTELENQLQDERIKAIKDGQEREIAEINTEFQRRIEAIKGNTQIEIDLRRQLEENKNAAFVAANEKFAKENAEKEAETIQKEYENRLAKLDAELITLETEGKTIFDKEREIAQIERDQKLADTKLSDEQALLAKAEYNQRVAEINAKQKEDEEKTHQQIEDAKLSIAQNSLNALSALGSLVIKDAQKQEKFQKGIAIAQIAIDTAKSISATIAGATAAAAAGGPAAPFLLAGYITQGLATVLGAFAQAKKLLGSSGSSAPSGLSGATGDNGTVTNRAPVITDPANGPRTLLNNNQQQDNKTLTIKAEVVETDMTDTQGRIKTIKENSVF